MFCKKCGKEIPDDSVFCPECGNKCELEGNEKKVTINLNAHGALDYILSSIKKPITTIKEKSGEVSNTVHIAIIAIVSLLIPLIHLGTLKSFIYKISDFITNIMSTYSFEAVSMRDKLEAQKNINEIIDNYVPFSKIYTLDLLANVLYLAIIVGLIYVVYKFVFRVNIDNKKFLSLLSVISILNIILVLITTVLVFIGLVPAMIVNTMRGILILTVLILGMREIASEENKLTYVVAIAYGISFFVTNYICIQYVISTVQDYMFGMLPQMF